VGENVFSCLINFDRIQNAVPREINVGLTLRPASQGILVAGTTDVPLGRANHILWRDLVNRIYSFNSQ